MRKRSLGGLDRESMTALVEELTSLVGPTAARDRWEVGLCGLLGELAGCAGPTADPLVREERRRWLREHGDADLLVPQLAVLACWARGVAGQEEGIVEVGDLAGAHKRTVSSWVARAERNGAARPSDWSPPGARRTPAYRSIVGIATCAGFGGRQGELARLAGRPSGVTFLVGPQERGKSSLLRRFLEQCTAGLVWGWSFETARGIESFLEEAKGIFQEIRGDTPPARAEALLGVLARTPDVVLGLDALNALAQAPGSLGVFEGHFFSELVTRPLAARVVVTSRVLPERLGIPLRGGGAVDLIELDELPPGVRVDLAARALASKSSARFVEALDLPALLREQVGLVLQACTSAGLAQLIAMNVPDARHRRLLACMSLWRGAIDRPTLEGVFFPDASETLHGLAPRDLDEALRRLVEAKLLVEESPGVWALRHATIRELASNDAPREASVRIFEHLRAAVEPLREPSARPAPGAPQLGVLLDRVEDYLVHLIRGGYAETARHEVSALLGGEKYLGKRLNEWSRGERLTRVFFEDGDPGRPVPSLSPGSAQYLQNLRGLFLDRLGRLQDALAAFEQATRPGPARPPRDLDKSSRNLALTLLSLGELPEAERRLRGAIDRATAAGDAKGASGGEAWLAPVYFLMGRSAEARALYARVTAEPDPVREASRDLRTFQYAIDFVRLGEAEQARSFLEAKGWIAGNEGSDLVRRGFAVLVVGAACDARASRPWSQDARAAVALADDAGLMSLGIRARLLEGILALHDHRPDRSIELAGDALNRARSCGFTLYAADALGLAAAAQGAAGREAEAAVRAREALEICEMPRHAYGWRRSRVLALVEGLRAGADAAEMPLAGLLAALL